MSEKTKVSITASENFENIMILMNARFAEIIKKDKHFFENLGKEIDAEFKENGYYD